MAMSISARVRSTKSRSAAGMNLVVAWGVILGACGLSCIRQTTVVGTQSSPQARGVQTTAADTVNYVLEFNDRRERKAFLRSLDAFLQQYPFDTLRRDSLPLYLRLRCIPAAGEQKEREQSPALAKVDRAEFSESNITPPTPAMAPEDVRPVAGGKAVLYSERPFLDETFASLLTTLPFAVAEAPGTRDAGQGEHYFDAVQLAPRKIRLSLTEAFKKSDGSMPGAFDLVEAWTGLVRDHPAEGKALFFRMAGIDAFIKGQEAIIAGIQITDERTISLTLSQNDPRALARMTTPRLLPPSFKTGPYSCSRSEKNRLVLTPNSSCPAGRPFLDQCTVVLGNDNNPFVSFSLNQYDLITLSQIKDLEYARRSLGDKAVLIPLPREIYFLSLTGANEAVRRYVRAGINARELLGAAAKVEGGVVNCIQSTACTTLLAKSDAPVPAPLLPGPLTILFRSDDRVSSRIAEKVVANLSHDSVRCILKGCAGAEYERALLTHEAGIAVGWVGESIWRDESECLRLAAMWFNDESDEAARFTSGSEIPLFIVNRYALCKKNIGLQYNELSRIYIRP
jgi:hypothetical protein